MTFFSFHLLEHLAGIGDGPVLVRGEVVDRPGVVPELGDAILDHPLVPEDDGYGLPSLNFTVLK
jgi:hypothetical protein